MQKGDTSKMMRSAQGIEKIAILKRNWKNITNLGCPRAFSYRSDW